MGIYQTEFFGSATLGLLGLVTENCCYLPEEIPIRQVHKISEVMNVPVKKTSFYNSFMLGLFSAGNSKYVFVPEVVSDREIKGLDKEIVRLEGLYTTLGNLILCNDKGCILSPYLRDKKQFFEKKLKLKTAAITISDLPFPGALAVVTNQGGIVHEKCKDTELDILEKILGVNFKKCGFYKGFPGAEILANSKGLIVPRSLKGQELAEIQEGLKVF